MNQPNENPNQMPPPNDAAANNNNNNNVQNNVQPMETDQPPTGTQVTFYCCCCECTPFYHRGAPIECINPCFVELRHHHVPFVNTNGAVAPLMTRTPVFRRPADPDYDQDRSAKRRKL